MSDLTGGLCEVRFTLEVTRHDTGKVDKVEMVGFAKQEDLEEFANERDTQHGSEKRSD